MSKCPPAPHILYSLVLLPILLIIDMIFLLIIYLLQPAHWLVAKLLQVGDEDDDGSMLLDHIFPWVSIGDGGVTLLHAVLYLAIYALPLLLLPLTAALFHG